MTVKARVLGLTGVDGGWKGARRELKGSQKRDKGHRQWAMPKGLKGLNPPTQGGAVGPALRKAP
eukprot:6535642-Pyramimonas_sp.AAC.1